MIRILCCLILLGVAPNLMAQKTAKENALIKKQREEKAEEHIQSLVNGALIVRLKTKHKAIRMLNEKGNTALADKIRTKQAKENQKVMEAFTSSYRLSPVYFVGSEMTQRVKAQEWDSLVFLNENAEPDSSITFEHESFLTAEFGIVRQDTMTNYEGHYDVSGKDSLERRKRYSGGTDLSFGALIVMDQQFNQLHAPFPYYVRTLSTLPVRREYSKVVDLMEDRLKRYAVSVMGKHAIKE